MAWYVALGVFGALAAIFPWDLGVKADPFISAPAGIKPEWYFLFMFQTLKLIPSKVGSLTAKSWECWLLGWRLALAAAAISRAGHLPAPAVDHRRWQSLLSLTW